MQRSETDSTLYVTATRLGRQPTRKEIFYKYVLETEAGVSETILQSYVVAGPDLLLKDIKLEQDGNNLVLKVLGTNVGNTPSITTDLKLYVGTTANNLAFFSSQSYPPLEVNELRWDSISLANLPNANLFLEVRVNTSNTFPEWEAYVNIGNYIRLQVPLNYYLIDSCLLYTSPSPRDRTRSRMPSSA